MARTSAKAKKQATSSNIKTEKLKEAASKSKEEESKDVGQNLQDPDDATDKENDDINYEVDKIVHTRIYRGKRQYLVRWKGYSEDSDTWENESVVQSCQEALDTFKKENSSLIDTSKNDSDNDGDDEGTEDNTIEEIKTKKSVNKSMSKFDQTNKKQSLKKRKTGDITEGSGDEEDESDSEVKEEKKKVNKKITKTNKTGNKSDKGTEEPLKKKAKGNVDSDESVTDGKNYEVEKIVEVHTRRDGSREFLIRWKGYRPSEDTWEPEAHLNCQDMIDKFMEKVDKAKSMPIRELRESRVQVHKYVPHNKGHRSNLRNTGKRPNYQE